MSLEFLTSPIKELDLSTAEALIFTGAALFAGRKFCIGVSCKLGSKVASFAAASKETAAAWNKTGDNYLKLAKKYMIQDLTGLASFMLALKVVGNLDALKELEKSLNWRNWFGHNPFKFCVTVVSSIFSVSSACESLCGHSLPYSVDRERRRVGVSHRHHVITRAIANWLNL
jgi:hypothetical protein